MRKYIIGGLVGFILATAASANAEGITKLIDQVVQGVFPVTVEGNSVGDAIVVDNKTYLPVREFGEAVGYKVTFTEDREVVLTKNTESNNPVVSLPATDKTVSEQIDDLKRKISEEQSSIEHGQAMIKESEELLKNPKFPKESIQQTIDMYKKQIEDNQKKITEFETQLSTLVTQQ